jgi:acetyl-CoA/propionyl-CoA carboxylase biotin carboxyl carrier protein
MIGKVIISGRDRQEALARARRAMGELKTAGVTTIAPMHRAILASPEFTAPDSGNFTVHTRWIDAELPRLGELARSFAPSAERYEPVSPDLTPEREPAMVEDAEPPRYRAGIKAPLSGVVMEICVNEGDGVAEGDIVAIMEAMKMEQPVMAEVSGTVAKINVSQGSFIDMDADIMGVD